MTTLAINGINGATGEYLTTIASAQEVSLQERKETGNREERQELADWIDFYAPEQRTRGPKEGVDPLRLDQAGWGIVFPEGAGSEALVEALSPLLALRRSQATDRYYREITYYPGESKNNFLSRHGAGPGPADPEKLPYYLLLVGDPATIPFRFQYQLDVQHAVGRLHFDTLEEYHQYAQSVVAAERGALKLTRQAILFGVRNPEDRATSLSTNHLVAPLAEKLGSSGWEISTCIAEAATKAELGRVLGGEATPAFLFTASHGIGFPAGDSRQIPHQGALLCQDWPGPVAWSGRGPIPPDHYFAADDVRADASLRGLIAFHFACYGAGTPKWDEFRPHQEPKGRRELAPDSFLSQLPRRLLGHPRGGALAVIGHIERAWSYSFFWEDGRQLAAFESVVRRILGGAPVGFAMEYLNQRYAELSTELSEELEKEDGVDDEKLCQLWTARNDARNYAVLGDPAVRTPAMTKDI